MLRTGGRSDGPTDSNAYEPTMQFAQRAKKLHIGSYLSKAVTRGWANRSSWLALTIIIRGWLFLSTVESIEYGLADGNSLFSSS